MTIREVGEQIAHLLNVEAEFGNLKGSECLIDPVELLPDWEPKVTLADGISQVISDARSYLTGKAAAV